MSNHEDALKNFQDRSGADEHKAAFYLEAAQNNLELALYNYLVTDGSTEDDAGTSAGRSPETDGAKLKREDEGAPSSVSIKKKNKNDGSNPKFATLGNLNQDSSSDEEEGQAFYAGGSMWSGQQIIGPGKNKNDIVSDMFRSVREHGGVVMNQEGGEGSSTFSGTGYKLGITPDDTIVVPDAAKMLNKRPDPEQVVVLRLWKNGFNLDDGELRNYDDPENADFLKYVRRGEIPPELRRGPEVFLTMEDRRHEDYTKISSGPSKPFQGKGQMLGSPVPSIIGSTASQNIGAKEQEVNQKSAQATLNVNESEPTTTIQFRLADGSRISGRFNHTHTVADVRQYITNSMPVYQLHTFVLLTTFPNKELTDNGQTIKDAGLLNALVVQKLK